MIGSHHASYLQVTATYENDDDDDDDDLDLDFDGAEIFSSFPNWLVLK